MLNIKNRKFLIIFFLILTSIFILNNTSAGQPFIEPSIANKFGTTHLGLRFGFLF